MAHTFCHSSASAKRQSSQFGQKTSDALKSPPPLDTISQGGKARYKQTIVVRYDTQNRTAGPDGRTILSVACPMQCSPEEFPPASPRLLVHDNPDS
jgi:hypothetical protein